MFLFSVFWPSFDVKKNAVGTIGNASSTARSTLDEARKHANHTDHTNHTEHTEQPIMFEVSVV